MPQFNHSHSLICHAHLLYLIRHNSEILVVHDPEHCNQMNKNIYRDQNFEALCSEKEKIDIGRRVYDTSRNNRTQAAVKMYLEKAHELFLTELGFLWYL